MKALWRRQHGADPVPHLGADFFPCCGSGLFRQTPQCGKPGPQLGSNGVELHLLRFRQLQLRSEPLAQGTESPTLRGLCQRLSEPGPASGLAHTGTGGAGTRRRCRGGRFNAGDTHAQRSVGNFQHVLARLNHDPHVGGHARQQSATGIGKTHHCHVGHHIGHVLRRLAHLTHLTLKRLSREGIDRESRLVARADAPDVGLINAGIHLHVLQILRNHKKLRCLQAGGHGLAFFNGALDDDAIDRRGNPGARQVDARLRQRGLALRHVGLGTLDLGFGHAELRLRQLQRLGRGVDQGARLVGFALGNELLLDQTELALQITLRFHQVHLSPRNTGPTGGRVGLRRQHVGTGRVHIGLRRAHPVFKGFRVDHGNQLTGLDLGVEINVQVLDLTRDLGSDRDLRHGVDRAASGHGGQQRAALDLGAAVLHGIRRRTLTPPPEAAAAQQRNTEHTDHEVRLFHETIVESKAQ